MIRQPLIRYFFVLLLGIVLSCGSLPVCALERDPAADGLVSGNQDSGDGDQGGDKVVQVRMAGDQKFIIYFNFDKFSIRQDAAEILAKVAYVLLEEYQQAQVLLTGHTDTRGALGYNEQLSKNRVNAAKKWLIAKGVDPARIKTDYHGELKLAKFCAGELDHEKNPDKCLSKEEHQLNRRVEVEILNALNNK